jgi:hypothetical protein
MKPPKCRLCEHAHWSNEPHVFASNTESASNTASNEVNSASNNRRGHAVENRAAGRPVAALAEGSRPSTQDGTWLVDAVGKPKQRWSRESYNAYQREYMRKKRGPKGG